MDFKYILSIIDNTVCNIIYQIDNHNNERRYLLPTTITNDTTKCKDCDLTTYVKSIKYVNRPSIHIHPITTIINISCNKHCDMV